LEFRRVLFRSRSVALPYHREVGGGIVREGHLERIEIHPVERKHIPISPAGCRKLKDAGNIYPITRYHHDVGDVGTGFSKVRFCARCVSTRKKGHNLLVAGKQFDPGSCAVEMTADGLAHPHRYRPSCLSLLEGREQYGSAMRIGRQGVVYTPPGTLHDEVNRALRSGQYNTVNGCQVLRLELILVDITAVDTFHIGYADACKHQNNQGNGQEDVLLSLHSLYPGKFFPSEPGAHHAEHHNHDHR